VSTRLVERPEVKRLFDMLRAGDTLVARWHDPRVHAPRSHHLAREVTSEQCNGLPGLGDFDDGPIGGPLPSTLVVP
jgi:hypothetical protein